MGAIEAAWLVAVLFAPTEDLRSDGFVTTQFQGSAYAVDPRDDQGYLFQVQAVAVGPKDIEDTRIHRFKLNGGELEYLDTETIVGGGHVQSLNVRISSAGNPYLWMGLEKYDSTGASQGNDLYRIRYRPGGKPTIVQRSSADVDRVYTGSGSVTVVGSTDWTIVLRRVGSTSDTFEFFSETTLLSDSVQNAAKGGTRPTPKAKITMPRWTTNDEYQSAVSIGRFDDDVVDRKVVRVTGGTEVFITSSEAGSTRVNITDTVKSVLGQTNVEPEGAFFINGLLYVAVQSDPSYARRVSYFPVSW